MDAEEARRLLAQVKVRYLILEADKEAESARVAKYRKILDTFAGEDSSGVTEPEATSFLHAARSVLAHPTLPVASVCCPNLYRGRVLMLTWITLSHHQVQRCYLWPDGLQPIPPWWAERAIHHLLRTLYGAQKGHVVFLMCHNLLLQSRATLRYGRPEIGSSTVWMWRGYSNAQVSHLLY